MDTALAALTLRAAARPDDEVLAVDDRRWSAAELIAAVAGAARWLSDRPAHPQSPVAICLTSPVEQLRWALAAQWIGAAPAVLDPRWPPAHLQAALQQLSSGLIIDEQATAAPGAAPGPPASHGSWISFTSGTSGHPRALRRSAESWTASFPAFTDMAAVSAADVVLVPGPLSSSMFAFAALHALAAGARIRLLSRWRPSFPGAAQVTVAHLVPTMLADLVENQHRLVLRPRVVVCAGAKLTEDLERRACASWPALTLVEYYGSTEQSFVTARTGADPGTVGSPFPGVQVQIRDDDGMPTTTGRPGMIWTRSRYAADGYVTGAAGRFRRADGWVSVGDRGRLDGVGVLTLLGRDQITTGGTTVDPAVVEAVLSAVPGVRDVVVVGLPHRRLGEVVTAILECQPDFALDVARRVARTHLGPAQRPRRWYGEQTLPRTGAGKPDRGSLLEAAREGRLRPLS